MNNFATLKKASPYYALFPRGEVPIVNIVVPNFVNCEGGGGPQDVYMVALDKLTSEQFEAVARLVHKQCDPCYPFEKAKAEMREQGLPLRAKHVTTVSTDVPFFL